MICEFPRRLKIRKPGGDSAHEEREEGEETVAKVSGRARTWRRGRQADDHGRELHPEVAGSRHCDHGRTR